MSKIISRWTFWQTRVNPTTNATPGSSISSAPSVSILISYVSASSVSPLYPSCLYHPYHPQHLYPHWYHLYPHHLYHPYILLTCIILIIHTTCIHIGIICIRIICIPLKSFFHPYHLQVDILTNTSSLVSSLTTNVTAVSSAEQYFRVGVLKVW